MKSAGPSDLKSCVGANFRNLTVAAISCQASGLPINAVLSARLFIVTVMALFVIGQLLAQALHRNM
jgi:hypothetical protein